jgi:hypothetical protein
MLQLKGSQGDKMAIRINDPGTRQRFSARGTAVLLAVLAACMTFPRADEGEMQIKEGVLDEITLKTLNAPKDVGVIIRQFSADRADLGTAERGDNEKRVDAATMMKREGPRVLAEEIVKVLSLGGAYLFARESDESVPENAIVVEGRFTKIDPGSRAKRWAVGFGAGKSGISVEGSVKNAAGEVLAEFSHTRKSGIGVGGGDYVKFLMDDTRDVAADLALFLKRWATGGNLHEDD